MNIIDIIDLNSKLTHQFTHQQLVNIIEVCYEKDRSFNRSVENFYTDIMEFDDDSAQDLIYDICHGDEDAFIRFAEDINYYCTEQK